eukprot:4401406-Pyramimonas_sp.AAC.1
MLRVASRGFVAALQCAELYSPMFYAIGRATSRCLFAAIFLAAPRAHDGFRVCGVCLLRSFGGVHGYSVVISARLTEAGTTLR